MNRHLSRNILKLRRKKRSAISETISTVILIAVTVVLGSVAWVWASSSSVNSQNSLGQAAQTNISAINEKFEIVASNFTYAKGCTAPCTSFTISIWFYDQGVSPATVNTIQLNGTNLPGSPWNIPQGQLTSPPVVITWTSVLLPPVKQGDLETIRAVGAYGFYFNYQVVA